MIPATTTCGLWRTMGFAGSRCLGPGLGGMAGLPGDQQYTYFQLAGGLDLDLSRWISPTAGAHLMVLPACGRSPIIRWADGADLRDLKLRGEVEFCTYNFQTDAVDNLRRMFELYEAEAQGACSGGSYCRPTRSDQVFACFNVLEPAAHSVTERGPLFCAHA
jgi:glycyl-tRNA synthetase alpha subunit